MEQTTWVKIGVIGGLSIILVAAGLGLKWQHDCLVKQEFLEKTVVEMQHLGNGVVRSQDQYISKDDLLKLAQNTEMQQALEDLKKLRADLTAVQTISATTPGYVGQGLSSTKTLPKIGTNSATISTDPYGYSINVQSLMLTEPMSTNSEAIPFGEVSFKSWEAKPWDVTVYPRTYKVTTVLGQDEDGRHYAYNKFSIESQGKQYPVELSQAKMEEELPESKIRFSPRFYLGLSGGLAMGLGQPTTDTINPSGFIQPNLTISLLSWGKTKVDPEWSFLGIGIGYEAPINRGSVVISPVSYNVGHHLPLINNLFIHPLIGVDTSLNVSLSAGVQVGL